MSSSKNRQSDGRLFNNADSFAIEFDSQWDQYQPEENKAEINTDQKLDLILAKLSEHPFVIESPSKAREVAKFRIRLLNLL